MHKITVGGWHTIDAELMQVISGPIGKEKVHFEAPSADCLEKEMQAFLAWFNNRSSIDPVNKEFLEANYLRRRASEYFAGFILT